jgi:hypothetical protein
MVHMPLSRLLALGGLVFLSACHFEDHTPAGSRRDEAQIREVVIEFYRGLAALDWGHVRTFFVPEGRVSFLAVPEGDSLPRGQLLPADSVLLMWARQAGERAGGTGEARVIRADLRQADGLAQLPFERRPGDGDREGVEHLVLHRTGEGWRIALLSLPWTLQ